MSTLRPPLRTELHRHLDASIRADTLAELIVKFKVAAPYKTAEDIRTKFWLTHQMGSLKEVLDCFDLFQKVLLTEEVLERIGFEAVLDAKAEQIDNIELRYSPTFTSEFSGVDWDKGLAAFKRGIDRGMKATGVKAGLICIVSRGYEMPQAERTIDFAIENKASFIGVDLAGPEQGYPCRIYKNMYQKAAKAGLPITIHAGEAPGEQTGEKNGADMWEAIDLLGARRIGHGIQCVKDPALMKRLAKDKILLEVCPTSNFITKSVQKFEDHPLPTLLSAGIPVSINTDDPGIFGVTLGEEYSRCKKYLGLSDSDLRSIDEYASHHSFLNIR